jgi:LemA protein
MSRLFSDTVKRLFPSDFEELEPVKKHWWQKIDFGNLKSKQGILITLLVLAVVLPGVHYWNHFVVFLTNAQTAEAQVGVQLQRRKDLLINLTKTVVDYAEHERVMFQFAAEKRLGNSKKADMLMDVLKKGGLVDLANAKTGNLEDAAAKLLALAEAYPELKLSANFQKMMDALVGTEDKLAECRMAYNEAANKFGTYAMSFPNSIYAFIFGFSPSDFPFVTIDKDAGEYNRIQY